MSREMTDPTKTPEHPAKSAIARVKKEEEEELWISGEELCTEGSSDEEDPRTQSRTRRKINGNRSRNNPNASEHRAHSSETNSSSKNASTSNEKGEKEPLSSSDDARTSSNASSSNTSRSPSLESRKTIPTDPNERPTTNEERNSSVDLSSEDNSPTNEEISWKARRETHSLAFEEAKALLHELQQNYQQISASVVQLQNAINTDNCANYDLIESDDMKYCTILEQQIDVEDDEIRRSTPVKLIGIDNEECNIKTDILNMQNLDTAIKELDIKLQEEKEETLLCQYNNRKRLKLLLSSSTETGKLAENTRQFFQLYLQHSEFIECDANNVVDKRINESLHGNESLCGRKELKNKEQPKRFYGKDTKLIKRKTDNEILDCTLEKYSQVKQTNTKRNLCGKNVTFNSKPCYMGEEVEEILNESDKKVLVLHRDTDSEINSTTDLNILDNISLLSRSIQININNTNIVLDDSKSTITMLEIRNQVERQ